jgi:hypothetical protein
MRQPAVSIPLPGKSVVSRILLPMRQPAVSIPLPIKPINPGLHVVRITDIIEIRALRLLPPNHRVVDSFGKLLCENFGPEWGTRSLGGSNMITLAIKVSSGKRSSADGIGIRSSMNRMMIRSIALSTIHIALFTTIHIENIALPLLRVEVDYHGDRPDSMLLGLKIVLESPLSAWTCIQGLLLCIS